jgi:hypothetical protein
MRVWFASKQLAFKRAKIPEEAKKQKAKYHRALAHLSNTRTERLRKLTQAVKKRQIGDETADRLVMYTYIFMCGIFYSAHSYQFNCLFQLFSTSSSASLCLPEHTPGCETNLQRRKNQESVHVKLFRKSMSLFACMQVISWKLDRSIVCVCRSDEESDEEEDPVTKKMVSIKTVSTIPWRSTTASNLMHGQPLTRGYNARKRKYCKLSS